MFITNILQSLIAIINCNQLKQNKMKLQNYTKAELISKLNKIKNDRIEQKSSIINKLKSYLSKLIELIINFKSILLKITLLTFFMKIFRKYRILRRIWNILNAIIISIFGISLLDNFGMEFISNLFKEIKIILGNTVNYLTNTNFYIFLNKLFSNPSSEIESKSNSRESMIKEISHETTRNESKTSESIRPNNRNSKISEWLKPESKIDDNEVIEESNNSKYYYIIGILVISALAWFYLDEIKTGGSSILEWIKSLRGDNDPGNNNRNLPIEGRINPRAELERLVRERTIGTEEKLSDLIDKSKGKSVRVMSPSLEDLNEKVQESWNASPTSSTSSIETVKASTSSIETVNPSEVKTESPFPLSGSFQANIEDKYSLLDLKTKWKDIIKSDLRQSIEYVEKHLPKNELDDTTYINGLLEDITNKNINYLKDLNNNSTKLKASKLIYLTEVGKNVDEWVEEMRTEINKFE
jgi:hypothetical protein